MPAQIAHSTSPLYGNTFTRYGYTFAGWNTLSGGGGVAYSNGATYSFAADMTLYAQWTPMISHTVIFNSNGGTGSMSNQIASSPTILTSNSFTRVGYNFLGWNTVSGGGGTSYSDGSTYSFSADITLYAQWTPVVVGSYTVTFAPNGGTGSMSHQVASSPTALTLNAFTRAGYTFTNWNTVSGGGGTSYSNGAIYAFGTDVTLYAQWTLGAFSIEYLVVAGGGGGGSDMGNNGSGGGGGGVLTGTGYSVPTGSPISVVVGAGGLGGGLVNSGTGYGLNGQNSVFGGLTAIGGGGGACASHPAGGSGGCGGGGSINGLGGSGVSGQGFNGGDGPGFGGAGGGGAGSVGGTPNWYTQGNPLVVANLPLGGGAFSAGGYVIGGFIPSLAGAGGQGDSGGFNGQRGLVSIRYFDSFPAATYTGTPTVTVSGGYRYYTWTAGSGSITF